MPNPAYVFIKELEEIQEPLTAEVVKQLFLSHFEGKRVFFSYRPDLCGKTELANKLIARGFTKSDAAAILIKNFNISKTWAYRLVAAAINAKYQKQIAADSSKLKELQITTKFGVR